MITRSQYKLFLTLKDKIVNLENKKTQTTCTDDDFYDDEDPEWTPDSDEDSSDDEKEIELYNDDEKSTINKSKKKKRSSNHHDDNDDADDDDEDEDDDEEDDNDDEEDEEENDELVKEEINDIICAVIHNTTKPPPKKRMKKDPSSSFEYNLTHKEEQYYDSLSSEDKDKYKNMYKSLVLKSNTNEIPNKFKILSLDINDYMKKIILQKCESLSHMDPSHGEYHKLNKWVTNVMKIPFGKYIEMPVNSKSNIEDIQQFLSNTHNILNSKIYGHTEAKDQMLRIVAQWIANPTSKGNVIGIHGNPGVGKTTLMNEGVSKALGLPFVFIPLGGSSDSSYLDGHSYTYEGSSHGKIIDMIIQAQCMNPIIYFDELDKVSFTEKGRELINVLIHLTDPSQNTHFQDKYFSEIPIDLSKCLIVFTYNNNNYIDPILKDRMITIHTKDYNTKDKIHITQQHLLPDLMNTFSLHDIEISEDVINYIIQKTPNEAGVRNLKRSLENIISNINLDKFTKNEYEKTISSKCVDKYIKSSHNDMNESIHHLYT